MRLEPLPFRTRLGHGEIVTSWAPRHAMNNGTSVKDIDAILRRQGVVTSRSPRDPERAKAWRALGGLHPRAFTEPQVVAGNWVINRPLCDRCMPHLEDGTGRVWDRGWVCLKHKRWTRDDEQTDLADFGEALVAERHWRGHAHATWHRCGLPAAAARPGVRDGGHLQGRPGGAGLTGWSPLPWPAGLPGDRQDRPVAVAPVVPRCCSRRGSRPLETGHG